MWDVRIAEIAGQQFNRISRAQLEQIGISGSAIQHAVASGRFVAVQEGVFAIAPVLRHDDWGRWSEAALTAPGSVLSRRSAAAAWEFWGLPREFETVTRPGNGGPRMHGSVRVHRSSTLEGDCTELRGIPITTPSRTLIDLAGEISAKALARSVRESVRLGLTSVHEIGDTLGRHRGRRGCRRLAETLARYTDLPLERARSGAEIHAMEALRDAGRDLPVLNQLVNGVEADLIWRAERLIIEIDGRPFHLDAGEDRRKEEVWRAAGWQVRRIDADELHEDPRRILRLAP